MLKRGGTKWENVNVESHGGERHEEKEKPLNRYRSYVVANQIWSFEYRSSVCAPLLS